MQTQVTQWGNSLGVRIPRVLASKLGVHAGDSVEVFLQHDHIVIRKRYSLQSMLDQISEENRHEEIETGKSCGKEIW